MDPTILKGLHDKFYEKRKAAALDLEKQVRDCHYNNEPARIDAILDQVTELFANTSHPLHVRNGGLIALAAVGIALGTDIAPYMEKFVKPLLVCFSDNESRIRYFAAESMYNIAKVARGEILVYFNPIFDALSKLSADSELSVKNGAELLDRLLKDTVAECATEYVAHPQSEKSRIAVERAYGLGVLVDSYEDGEGPSFEDSTKGVKKAFSLANFIPLLADRIYVLSPFTRSFLISWIGVLDSIPDLEMVSYLPHFLDGLLKYLSDPTDDVITAAENLLADFLREIKEIAIVSRKQREKLDAKRLVQRLEQERLAAMRINGIDTSSEVTGATSIGEGGTTLAPSPMKDKTELPAIDERDTGVWMPGQGVKVDHAAIVEILINQLDGDHEEIQQSIALKWIHEFLTFTQDVMVPFTPRLIPAILPSLAHHVPDIQTAAIKANQLLFNVIQGLPAAGALQGQVPNLPSKSMSVPASAARNLNPLPASTGIADNIIPSSSPPAPSPLMNRQTLDGIDPNTSKPRAIPSNLDQGGGSSSNSSVADKDGALVFASNQQQSRPGSPTQDPERKATLDANNIVEAEPFDYHATVSALTIRFLSEYEDTRVAALKWLIMLHQKLPNKILAMDDGTFPALLKNLSDSSEEVIKYDLQLLAQISTHSDESYFKSFMISLLGLFSTDKRLLETRGSLIIRQLCISLNTEKIYRTLAEILEKEEDLAFASNMVQKLNLILITSPELAEFRKRLKTLETRQDGQALFVTLYRSWCHNAVAAFSLCLLAQAYEHASNLLQIFAELEITVQLLVQIDKLVQLIESPVFTYLRLQLLEPDKYPYLYKCLYGLLMLLPQSPAFISLRNRLNAVSSLGFLHITPKPTTNVNVNVVASSRSKLGREDIKWQDLFAHFRFVQGKHEKARRLGMGGNPGPLLDGYSTSGGAHGVTGQVSRSQSRKRTTGDAAGMTVGVSNGSAGGAGGLPSATAPGGGQIYPRTTSPSILSPLNPRARTGSNGLVGGATAARSLSPTSMLGSRAKRGLSITRK